MLISVLSRASLCLLRLPGKLAKCACLHQVRLLRYHWASSCQVCVILDIKISIVGCPFITWSDTNRKQEHWHISTLFHKNLCKFSQHKLNMWREVVGDWAAGDTFGHLIFMRTQGIGKMLQPKMLQKYPHVINLQNSH